MTLVMPATSSFANNDVKEIAREDLVKTQNGDHASLDLSPICMILNPHFLVLS